MQLVRPELQPPNGKDFWVEFQEDGEKPIFSLMTVSSVFFARSKLWLWRQITEGYAVLDGVPIIIPQADTYGRAYLFQLAHVERISHAFFTSGRIKLKQFENSLLVIRGIGSNYKLL